MGTGLVSNVRGTNVERSRLLFDDVIDVQSSPYSPKCPSFECPTACSRNITAGLLYNDALLSTRDGYFRVPFFLLLGNLRVAADRTDIEPVISGYFFSLPPSPPPLSHTLTHSVSFTLLLFEKRSMWFLTRGVRSTATKRRNSLKRE